MSYISESYIKDIHESNKVVIYWLKSMWDIKYFKNNRKKGKNNNKKSSHVDEA